MSRKKEGMRHGVAPRDIIRQPEPLTWWRTMRADQLDAPSATVLRKSIATIAIIDETSWRAAAIGEAAAAVGLALRLDPARATPIAFDLVMTALAACAADGDSTACLAMPFVQRRRPGAGKSEARIATSWLVRSFAGVLRKKRRSDLVELIQIMSESHMGHDAERVSPRVPGIDLVMGRGRRLPMPRGISGGLTLHSSA
jgi:hypothetical protein